VVERPTSAAGFHPQPRLFGVGLPPRTRARRYAALAQPERTLSNSALVGIGESISKTHFQGPPAFAVDLHQRRDDARQPSAGSREDAPIKTRKRTLVRMPTE
jgi:hypothetical protein